jgi:hypothetical protein
MIRLPALGEWLLIEMAVSRFGEFVLLIHYSRSDFSIAAVPLNPNWVELDATKLPFVILHNRPISDIEANARIVIAMQSPLWYAAINDSIQGDGYGYQSCGSKC